MKQVQILTSSLAGLCVSLVAAPVLAQAGQDQWRDRAASIEATRTTTMRAGPEAGYPAVRNIARGGRVTVHGCLDDRSWCDVSYGNDRGWVSGSEFSGRYDGREDNLANLSFSIRIGTVTFSFGDYWENHYRQRPFYSERYRWEQHYFDTYQPNWGPRPGRSYWSGRRQIGYMLRRSWMRAGPDYGYPAVRRINRNVQVTVYGCLRDWSWCDIGYQRDRGWVPGRDLAATYQGHRRSIESVAPYLGIGILSFAFRVYWDDHYRDRSFYRERDRWEQQYQQNYRPVWGPRQESGQDHRDGTRPTPPPPPKWPGQPQPQPYPAPQPQPQPQWQGQPQPRVLPEPAGKPTGQGTTPPVPQPTTLPPIEHPDHHGKAPQQPDRKPKPEKPDRERPGHDDGQ